MTIGSCLMYSLHINASDYWHVRLCGADDACQPASAVQSLNEGAAATSKGALCLTIITRAPCFHRRQRRGGPWRLRSGRCTIFLSFLLIQQRCPPRPPHCQCVQTAPLKTRRLMTCPSSSPSKHFCLTGQWPQTQLKTQLPTQIATRCHDMPTSALAPSSSPPSYIITSSHTPSGCMHGARDARAAVGRSAAPASSLALSGSVCVHGTSGV